MSVKERVLEHLGKALNYILRGLRELEHARLLCLREAYNVIASNAFDLKTSLNNRISTCVFLAEDILRMMRIVRKAKRREES